MNNKITVAAFLFLFCSSLIAQEGRSILVSPEWVANRMGNDNFKIFHVDNEDGYKKEHILGAQFLSWKEYTYDDDTHVFDFPEVEALEKMFESKGINDGDDIVLYVDSPMIPMMSRVYLTLNYVGFSGNVYLLNGGLDIWKAEGKPTSKEVPVFEKGSMTTSKTDLLATLDFVKGIIDNPEVNIVDGRASVFYQGIEAGNGGKSRKGHIVKAKTIPFTSLYEKNEKGAITFLEKDRLAKIFADQGLDKDKQLVLYCHIGMQLSAVYVASQVLGYENVKVYDGSFYEWGPNESLPIELENY